MARAVALIGGLLILLSIPLGFGFILLGTGGNLGWVPSSLGELFALGFLVDICCGFALVLSDDALLMMITGILATISSFLLVGGVVGGIGGILGIVGSALITGEETKKSAREEFLAARGGAVPSSPPSEQHSIRCPTCGYLNKADSVFCGKCRSPLRLGEDES